MAPGAGSSPSPVLPILLLIILVSMMMIPSYVRYDHYTMRTVNTLQNNMTWGAILIPVVLVIAVQAFGMPQHRQVENSQNSAPGQLVMPASLAYLLVVVIAWFILIGINSSALRPLQPHPSSYVTPKGRYYGYRRSNWYAMY